jgi:hypothetical protein
MPKGLGSHMMPQFAFRVLKNHFERKGVFTFKYTFENKERHVKLRFEKGIFHRPLYLDFTVEDRIRRNDEERTYVIAIFRKYVTHLYQQYFFDIHYLKLDVGVYYSHKNIE